MTDPFKEALSTESADEETSLRQRFPQPVQEPSIDDKLPSGFSRREIIQMRAAGMDKPDMIPWPEWLGPKKLNHRQLLMCHLAAMGYSNREIASSCRFTEGRVSLLLNSPEMKAQIQLIREASLKGLGVQGKLDLLAVSAVRFYDRALNEPGMKSSIVAKVAEDVLSRKFGKPNQKIEVSGSLLKDFIGILKEKDRGEITDAELVEDDFLPDLSAADAPGASQASEGTTKQSAGEIAPEIPSKELPLDPSEWIKENLG